MKRLPSYSQNFLRSPQLVETLIRRTSIKDSDTVYDLGAGSGVITSVLARYAGKVIAVEVDQRVIETLRKNCQAYKNVQIEAKDILNVTFPNTPYKIFANIPFHLSSQIVRRFVHNRHAPQAAYLIVQKQFGRKLIASNAAFFTSQLGMLTGAEYDVRIARKLERTDFWPHPAVDTVLISLEKRPRALVPPEKMAAYIRFTETCFADRNKLAAMPLETINATPGLSPSRLTITEWVKLFNAQTKYR